MKRVAFYFFIELVWRNQIFLYLDIIRVNEKLVVIVILIVVNLQTSLDAFRASFMVDVRNYIRLEKSA